MTSSLNTAAVFSGFEKRLIVCNRESLKSFQREHEAFLHGKMTAKAAADMRIYRIKMGQSVYQFLKFQNAIFRLGTINPAQSSVMSPAQKHELYQKKKLLSASQSRKSRIRPGGDRTCSQGTSTATAYYLGLSAYILTLIQKVNAAKVPIEDVYVCMINDRLTTENTGILSDNPDLGAIRTAAFQAYPLATSNEGDNADWTQMRAFCATLPGKEDLLTDPVQCRGFCKPVPKLCRGEGADYLKRYCRISNHKGYYLHFRLFKTTDPMFHEISTIAQQELSGAIGGCRTHADGHKGLTTSPPNCTQQCNSTNWCTNYFYSSSLNICYLFSARCKAYSGGSIYEYVRTATDYANKALDKDASQAIATDQGGRLPTTDEAYYFAAQAAYQAAFEHWIDGSESWYLASWDYRGILMSPVGPCWIQTADRSYNVCRMVRNTDQESGNRHQSYAQSASVDDFKYIGIIFPQPYYDTETDPITRRSTPSSTASDTCTHDPLFNENLKVVDMCKNRELKNCIDQNRLWNRMESGKECKDYELFAGKYIVTAASVEGCLNEIKILQLDFDYVIWKSATRECIFIFGNCEEVEKVGSDLYYLTQDCWVEEKKQSGCSIGSTINSDKCRNRPVVGKGKDFTEECKRICLNNSGCNWVEVGLGEEPCWRQTNKAWCYMYGTFCKSETEDYFTGQPSGPRATSAQIKVQCCKSNFTLTDKQYASNTTIDYLEIVLWTNGRYYNKAEDYAQLYRAALINQSSIGVLEKYLPDSVFECDTDINDNKEVYCVKEYIYQYIVMIRNSNISKARKVQSSVWWCKFGQNLRELSYKRLVSISDCEATCQGNENCYGYFIQRYSNSGFYCKLLSKTCVDQPPIKLITYTLPPIPIDKSCYSKQMDKSSSDICKLRSKIDCNPTQTEQLCYWNDPNKIFQGAICINKDIIKHLEHLQVSFLEVCHNRCQMEHWCTNFSFNPQTGQCLVFGLGCQFSTIDTADKAVETYEIPGYETPNMDFGCTHRPEFGYIKGDLDEENSPIIQQCKALVDQIECEEQKINKEGDRGCQWMCNEYQDYPYYFNWSTPLSFRQIIKDTLPATTSCASLGQYCRSGTVVQDYQYDFSNPKSILELMCCQCGRGKYVLPSLKPRKCTHRNTQYDNKDYVHLLEFCSSMKEDMCNDKVEYDPEFAVDGVIKPVARAPRLDLKTIKLLAARGDACYYTTPNLLATKQYCANPEEPEFTLTAQTAQTVATCHAWCQSNTWCTNFFINTEGECKIFSYGCTMESNEDYDAYTRSGYTQTSILAAKCTHLPKWGDLIDVVNKCDQTKARIACDLLEYCRWNCADTKDWSTTNWLRNSCQYYSDQRYCQRGSPVRGQEPWFGAKNAYPEHNCCACGKDKAVIYTLPSTENKVCTQLPANNNSTLIVDYCKAAPDAGTCEKPFEREWFCFWNGVLPSTTPLTCTHLLEYARDSGVVAKCRDIRFKAICQKEINKECQFIPGAADAVNQQPEFQGILPKEYQYLVIISGAGEVLNEDFLYRSPVLQDREDDRITLKVVKPAALRQAEVTLNADNSFSIAIKKELFNSKLKGKYTFTVRVKDDKHSNFEDVPFELVIKVQELDFKKKQVAIQETKKIIATGFYDKTFDNVDPGEIQQALQARDKLRAAKLYAAEEAVGVRAQPATPDGSIAVEFSQDTLAPSEQLQQFEYGEMFLLSIKADADGSVAYGTFGDQAGWRRALQETDDDDESQAAKLAFKVRVEVHDRQGIKFRLDFENPGAVSPSSNWDVLTITFLKPWMFRGSKSYKTLPTGCEACQFAIQKAIPGQMSDQALGENLVSSADNGGQFLRVIQSGVFFQGLFFKDVLDKLWGSMRAIQMITYPSLCQINYPPQTQLFLQVTIQYANMDVFGNLAEEHVLSRFTLVETEPYSQQFESFDFQSQNWVLLSGSYIIVKYGFVFLMILYRIVNKLCVQLKDYSWARKVGSLVWKPSYWRAVKELEKKLFMETYLDLCVMCSLTYHSWMIPGKNYWGTWQDVYSQMSAVISGIFIILFPLYGSILLYRHRGGLDEPHFKSHWGILYAAVRVKTYLQSLFNVLAMTRRWIMVGTLVVLKAYPYFQVSIMTFLSLLNAAYLMAEAPWLVRKQTNIDIIGELVVYVNVWTSLLFEMSITPEARSILGWLQIVNTSLVMLIGITNLVIGIPASIGHAVDAVQRAHQSRHDKVELDELKTLLAPIIAEYPTEFIEEQRKVNLLEDLHFCNDWAPQRNWLMNNGIELSDYDEEWRYLTVVRENKLVVKGNLLKIYKSVLDRIGRLDQNVRATDASGYTFDRDYVLKSRRPLGLLQAKPKGNEQRTPNEHARQDRQQAPGLRAALTGVKTRRKFVVRSHANLVANAHSIKPQLEQIREDSQEDQSLDEEIAAQQHTEREQFSNKLQEDKVAKFTYQANKFAALKKGQERLEQLLGFGNESKAVPADAIVVNPDALVFSADRDRELREIARHKMIVHEKLERSCLNKYILDQIETYAAKMAALAEERREQSLHQHNIEPSKDEILLTDNQNHLTKTEQSEAAILSMYEQIDSAVKEEDGQSEFKDGATPRPERDIENQEEEKRQDGPSESAKPEASASSSSEESEEEKVPAEPAKAEPEAPAKKELTAEESAALKAQLGRFLTFELGMKARDVVKIPLPARIALADAHNERKQRIQKRLDAKAKAEAEAKQKLFDEASSYETLSIKSETAYAIAVTEIQCNGKVADPIIRGSAVAQDFANNNIEIALGLDLDTLVADYNQLFDGENEGISYGFEPFQNSPKSVHEEAEWVIAEPKASKMHVIPEEEEQSGQEDEARLSDGDSCSQERISFEEPEEEVKVQVQVQVSSQEQQKQEAAARAARLRLKFRRPAPKRPRRTTGPAQRARAAAAELHDALEARDTARLLAEVRHALDTDTVDTYVRNRTISDYRC